MLNSAAVRVIPLLSFCLFPPLNPAETTSPSDQDTVQEVLRGHLTKEGKDLFKRKPNTTYPSFWDAAPRRGTYLLSSNKTSLAWMIGPGRSETIYLNGAVWAGPYSETYDADYGNDYCRYEPYATFSPDGRHLLARVEKTAGVWKAVLDGKEIPGQYEAIYGASFAGPDSNKILLTVKSGKHQITLLDGKQLGGECDRTQSHPTLHGSRLAFVARRRGKPVLIIDGKDSDYLQPYEEVEQFVFSPDGNHVAFAGRRAGMWFVNSDGKEQNRRYPAVAGLTYAPDSQRLVICAASDAEYAKTKYRYVIGDQEDPEFDAIQGLWWDSLGNRYYFGITYPDVTKTGWAGFSKPDLVSGRLSMVVGGQADAAPVTFRPLLAGIRELTDEYSLAPRHVPVLPKGLLTDRWGDLDMTADREGNVHFYAVLTKGEKCVVGWDGKKDEPVSCPVTNPQYSKDGKHLVYLTIAQGAVVEVTDSEPRVAATGVKSVVQAPVWSAGPDARVAFVVKLQTNNLVVAVDHKAQREWPAKEITDLLFSPDGRSFAYRVVSRNGKQQLAVLNGREGKAYDVVIPDSLRFDDRGSLNYFAVDGRDVYRVTQKPN